MRDPDRIEAKDGAPAGVPTQCPACRSPDVKTASRVVTTESYWRCESCGEVWNVARQEVASRYGDRRPFRR